MSVFYKGKSGHCTQDTNEIICKDITPDVFSSVVSYHINNTTKHYFKKYFDGIHYEETDTKELTNKLSYDNSIFLPSATKPCILCLFEALFVGHLEEKSLLLTAVKYLNVKAASSQTTVIDVVDMASRCYILYKNAILLNMSPSHVVAFSPEVGLKRSQDFYAGNWMSTKLNVFNFLSDQLILTEEDGSLVDFIPLEYVLSHYFMEKIHSEQIHSDIVGHIYHNFRMLLFQDMYNLKVDKLLLFEIDRIAALKVFKQKCSCTRNGTDLDKDRLVHKVQCYIQSSDPALIKLDSEFQKLFPDIVSVHGKSSKQREIDIIRSLVTDIQQIRLNRTCGLIPNGVVSECVICMLSVDPHSKFHMACLEDIINDCKTICVSVTAMCEIALYRFLMLLRQRECCSHSGCSVMYSKQYYELLCNSIKLTNADLCQHYFYSSMCVINKTLLKCSNYSEQLTTVTMLADENRIDSIVQFINEMPNPMVTTNGLCPILFVACLIHIYYQEKKSQKLLSLALKSQDIIDFHTRQCKIAKESN